MTQLINRGFSRNEIVLLTPNKDWDPSRASAHLQLSIDRFGDSETNANSIRWSTIQAFKGLEAPAIVIVGMENPALSGIYEWNSKLLYVALTRAKHSLSLVCDRNSPMASRILSAGACLHEERLGESS